MKTVNELNNEAAQKSTKLLDTSVEFSSIKGKNILTYGTFDHLHEGHLKIIRHALEYTDESNIYIGVSSDRWNNLKGKKSDQTQIERVKAISDAFPSANIFIEDHLKPEETWPEHWDKFNISLIIMGGDHANTLNYINRTLSNIGNKMSIVFYERTPGISSTKIRKILKDE